MLTGNGKSSELFGGSARDRLVGKGGRDVLDRGGGNDRIDARDGAASLGRAAQAGSVDRVVCGAGEDTGFVDPEQVVDTGCEHVFGAPQHHPPATIVA